jgi:hypothetical protein
MGVESLFAVTQVRSMDLNAVRFLYIVARFPAPNIVRLPTSPGHHTPPTSSASSVCEKAPDSIGPLFRTHEQRWPWLAHHVQRLISDVFTAATFCLVSLPDYLCTCPLHVLMGIHARSCLEPGLTEWQC